MFGSWCSYGGLKAPGGGWHILCEAGQHCSRLGSTGGKFRGTVKTGSFLWSRSHYGRLGGTVGA